MTFIAFETNDTKAKIFTKFTNNELDPLMFDHAEAKFVSSEHHTFGKKSQILKKT